METTKEPTLKASNANANLYRQVGRRRRRFRRDYLIVIWTLIFAYYYTAPSGLALPRPADSQEDSHYTQDGPHIDEPSGGWIFDILMTIIVVFVTDVNISKLIHVFE